MRTQSVFLLVALAVTLFASQNESFAQIDASVTVENCVTGTTIVSKKETCYVLDVLTMEEKVYLKICAGLNVSGGTLVIGGSASSFACVQLEVSPSDIEDGFAIAEERLKELLLSREVVQEASSKLSVESIDAIGDFELVNADEETQQTFEDMIGELNLDPFPDF